MSITERLPVHNNIENRETTEYRKDLLGLSLRLYLGEDALNPQKTVETFVQENIQSHIHEEYDLLDFTSQKERREHWEGKNNDNFTEQKNTWSQNLVTLFNNSSDFFASQKGQRWSALFSKIGIDTENFSTESANALYSRYFDTKHELSGVRKFVMDMYAAHLKDDQAVDLVMLNQNMEAIEWISHIFGNDSSQIISLFTNIKLRMEDGQEKVRIHQSAFTNNNFRVNALSDEEQRLAALLWNNKQQMLTKPSDKASKAVQKDIPRQDEKLEVSQKEHEQEIPQKSQESELSAEAIADRLLNYETGRPKGEQIDLRQSFVNFAQNVIKHAEDERFSSEQPTIILSDVAYTMLLKILASSNRKNRELAFTVRGLWTNISGKNILIGGLVVPAMDFTSSHQTHVALNPQLADGFSRDLAHDTCLDEIFSEFSEGRNEKGDILCIGHTHQEPLGRHWFANPSQQDYAQAENALRTRGANFSYEWGVFTLADSRIHKKILSSTLENGQRVDKELNLLTESEF